MFLYLCMISLLSLSAAAHGSKSTPKLQEVIDIEKLANFFLNTLEKEEYVVLSNQRVLFNEYEKLLANIFQLPMENIEQRAALCFAQALTKGANIYRRIATEHSLTLALNYHLQALAIRKKQLDCYAHEVADSLVYVAATYNELKGTENNIKAIECYKLGLAIYEHNQEQGKRYAASTLYQLGNAYRDLNENSLSIAIDYVDRAIQLFDTLPHDENVQREKAKALYNQGVNHHLLGDIANIRKAIAYLNSAQRLFELNNDAARCALTLCYLGNVYRETGNENISLAIDTLHQALRIQNTLFDSESPEIAATLYALGMAHHDAEGNENRGIALEYLKSALKIQKMLLRKMHQDIARTTYHLGLMYLENKEFDAGIHLIQEAFAIFKLLSPEHYYIKIAQRSFQQLRTLLAGYGSQEATTLLSEPILETGSTFRNR